MDDDHDSMQDYFSDSVKPLSSKYQNIHQKPVSKRLKRPNERYLEQDAKEYMPLNYYQLEHLESEAHDVLSYQQSPMNHRHWKQFRLGKITTAEPLDLHGYTRNDAWEAVQNYVDHLYYTQQKYGLIIHGKGHYSADGVAYLKNLLVTHLHKLPKVLAYHSANQQDGGTGATYIAIKTDKG